MVEHSLSISFHLFTTIFKVLSNTNLAPEGVIDVELTVRLPYWTLTLFGVNCPSSRSLHWNHSIDFLLQLLI